MRKDVAGGGYGRREMEIESEGRGGGMMGADEEEAVLE